MRERAAWQPQPQSDTDVIFFEHDSVDE